MEANRQAVEREKASLETLISNIAHQVRTPVANLRMLYDTLLARPAPWAQQRQFLQAAQGQLDKLDFLLQALVKTSRLETGLITLEKRDRPVADTLAAALNTVLAPWRPRGSISRWTARRASPSPTTPSGRRRPCPTFWTTR